MLPMTTRAVTTEFRDADSWRVWYRKRQKTVQKAPFNLPAPYFLMLGFSDPGSSIFTGAGSPEYDASQIASQAGMYDDLETQAANLSYERLREQISTNAALGVDFVEYRQSVDMIAKRAGTLLNFGRALRKFDFPKAARILVEAQPARVKYQHQRFGFSRIETIPQGVSPHKTLANNWLEFHFGWEPLYKDIFDAMEVLHNPVKKFAKFEGSAKIKKISYFSPIPTGAIKQSSSTVVTVRHKQGCFVKAISDPNLHTLEQLGLTNPAVLAWEVIPFSFVVDWFASVGDVLRSYSDFAGMTLTNQFSSIAVKVTNDGICYVLPQYETTSTPGPRLYKAEGLYSKRTTALTQPEFSVKQVRLPSLIRGATAISLLTQFLRK